MKNGLTSITILLSGLCFVDLFFCHSLMFTSLPVLTRFIFGFIGL